MGGSRTSSTTTTQQLAPEQQELLDLVIPTAEGFINSPPELFPGSAIAGFDPLQTAAQESALDVAGNFLTPFTQSTADAHSNLQGAAIPLGTAGLGELIGGATAAQPARDFFLSGDALSPDSNPFLASTADAAIGRVADNLTSEVLPSIRRGAQSAGQVGSSRQGIAEGLAIRDFTDTAGDISANIFSQGFADNLGATTQVLGQTQSLAGDAASSLLSEGTRSLFAAPQIADLALLPTQILEAVGATRQGQTQNLLTEEANRFMTDQLLPFIVAQDIANLAFGIPGGSTTSSGSVPGPSGLETALGLGSLIAGFL